MKLYAICKSMKFSVELLLGRRRYLPQWSYPGDIKTHMRNAHGITGSDDVQELEILHDRIHAALDKSESDLLMYQIDSEFRSDFNLKIVFS